MKSLNPAEIVILRGESEEISRWALAIGAVYTPKRLVFAIPDDRHGPAHRAVGTCTVRPADRVYLSGVRPAAGR